MTWIAGMVWQLPFLAVFAFVYTDELLRFVIEIFYARSCRWVKPVTPQGVAAMPGFRQELAAMRKKK